MAIKHTPAQMTTFDASDCRVYARPPDSLAFYDVDNCHAWISTEDAVDLRGIR